MRGIRDKVAIVGMGVTKTGEFFDKSIEDLLIEATSEALTDARLDINDVQSATLGVQYSIVSPPILAHALKTGHMPVTAVQNLCATGGDTFRNAIMQVASGMYDIVMAAGGEKLKDEGGTGIPGASVLHGTQHQAGSSAPAGAAPFAVRYMHHYGYSEREMREALARIAVKNHQNGTLNPKAHFQKAVTMEQVLDAPMIAWPLGLYDCCANVDGAAAAIVTTPEIARQLGDDYVLVRASAATTSDGTQDLTQSFDHASYPENEIAARLAYEMAGIKNPVKELSEVQIHDAFSIVELLNYEDLGLVKRGTAPHYIKEGFFDREGEMPVNTDGGLKCFGHPVGATGLKMLYEPYLQILGRAGPRQLPNVSLCLAQNQGGGNAASSVITILAPRD